MRRVHFVREGGGGGARSNTPDGLFGEILLGGGRRRGLGGWAGEGRGLFGARWLRASPLVSGGGGRASSAGRKFLKSEYHPSR